MSNNLTTNNGGGLFTGASSAIQEVVKAIMATLFMRRNTEIKEFETLKTKKFSSVADQLLESGNISYVEYYKCKNFMHIAEIADRVYSEKHQDKVNNNVERDFDWFIRFYDYSSIVSNEMIQEIWAKILVEEVLSPGQIRFSLLFALHMMDSSLAMLFNSLSKFTFLDDHDIPNLMVYLTKNRSFYQEIVSDLVPKRLSDLERIGLIHSNYKEEFVFMNRKNLRVGNNEIRIYGDPDNGNKIKAGNIVYTHDGSVLYSIIHGRKNTVNKEVMEYTIRKLQIRNCTISLKLL